MTARKEAGLGGAKTWRVYHACRPGLKLACGRSHRLPSRHRFAEDKDVTCPECLEAIAAERATTKVVFLDFDGVINSDRWFDKFQREGSLLVHIAHEANAIDPEAVERLNRLLDATGAVCVLSTSWRHGYPVARLVEFLRSRGFRGEVIGRTPMSNEVDTEEWKRLETCEHERGLEIATWLRSHPEVAAYVVLDDCPVGLDAEERRIATTFAEGLTDEHVERAIEMLGRAAENEPGRGAT